ncbi:MAG: cadherin-like domain-containing protein [Sandaracinaceae bacterium]|jgi:hypothetical protein|nr:cadherin-like domain-containing protein [Sandaracinaceae bacterium]MBK7772997.1 cadherin-like domain-containing protein [Sandaracinaceae bacterium]MBK8407208.1 cadherin-like domain-containing protein [Sandaracinaceae bacterium]
MSNLPTRAACALRLIAVLATLPMLAPTRAAADPTLDAPVMVTLTAWVYATEPVQVELLADGMPIATIMVVPGSFVFESSTTGAALESITSAPLCTNLSARLVGGSASVGVIAAEVTWAVSGVESHCLHDDSGGDCDDPWRALTDNGPPASSAAGTTWYSAPGDRDGDTVDDCLDPDIDADGLANAQDLCPGDADPLNTDTDGNGVGNVCELPTRPLAVPWLGDPTRPHTAVAGVPILLQGVALGRGDTPAVITSAEWDPGDGSPAVPLDTSDPRELATLHTYTGTPGQTFEAVLTVTDRFGVPFQAVFLVMLREPTLDAEMEMTIDRALWSFHASLGRYTAEGVPAGVVMPRNHYPNMQEVLPLTVQALAVNNHLPDGDGSVDPYVHDVSRLLRWLEVSLQVVPAPNKNAGAPDGNGNGNAIRALNSYRPCINSLGGIALIASAAPERVALLGPVGARGLTYRQLVEDMVDYYALTQIDNATNFPPRGSWGDSGFANAGTLDTESGGCAASVMHLARRAWGIAPAAHTFVRSENSQSLSSYATRPPSSYGPRTWYDGAHSGTFPETTFAEGVASTAAGGLMHLHNRVGYDPLVTGGGPARDLLGVYLWTAEYHRLNDNYGSGTPDSNGIFAEGLRSIAMAYRLAADASGNPTPIRFVDDRAADEVPPWDWFRNDVPSGSPASAGPKGMARALLDHFPSWLAGAYMDSGILRLRGPAAVPIGVTILSQAVVERGPRAECQATASVRTQAGVEVTLDASTSFHLDAARDVVSYAWELGDGATATGDVVTHVYATPQTLPLRYVPTITVTDDQGIPHSSSCVVRYTNTAPTSAGRAYTTEEDEALDGNVLMDDPAAQDVDGHALTAEVVTPPMNGMLVLAAGGAFTYTPAPDFFGMDTFIYRVRDELNGSVTATVTITVTSVDEPPNPDAGVGMMDAGMMDAGMMDAGMGTDAGMVTTDAGMVTTDTGVGTMDAGMVMMDAGMGTMDAGMGTMDAGGTTPDGGTRDSGVQPPPAGGGGGCSASSRADGAAWWPGLLLLALAHVRRSSRTRGA